MKHKLVYVYWKLSNLATATAGAFRAAPATAGAFRAASATIMEAKTAEESKETESKSQLISVLCVAKREI